MGGKYLLTLLAVALSELELDETDDPDEVVDCAESVLNCKLDCWGLSKEPITEATGATPSSDTCEVPPS